MCSSVVSNSCLDIPTLSIMFRTQPAMFKFPKQALWSRMFSVSSRRDKIRNIDSLPRRLLPKYQGMHHAHGLYYM